MTNSPRAAIRTRRRASHSLLALLGLYILFLALHGKGVAVRLGYSCQRDEAGGGGRRRAAAQAASVQDPPLSLHATADQGPHLVVGAFWGLTNQRSSLLRGLEAARKLNSTLVVPSWYLDYDDPPDKWDIKPFDYFFDFEAFSAGAASLGVRVARALPPALQPACTAQLQHTKVAARDVSLALLARWQARWGVACLNAANTLVGLETLANDSEAFTHTRGLMLRPSAPYAALVAAALTKVGRRYVAVAGRTEGDFYHACKVGYTSEKRLFKKKCYVDDAGIADALSRRFGLRNRTALFVASDFPKDRFPVLCGHFDCFKRSDVVDARSPFVAEMERHVTSKAFFDFLLCQAGAAFYGNVYSSFSRHIHQSFLEISKPADFFNPNCTGGDCN